MTTLENRINELKNGRTLAELKKECPKTYYQVRDLASKLSEERAMYNGQFLTKEHLVEFKPLIIWIMKNKTNFAGYLNLKSAMTILLNRVESENITFKTKKGIKGIITKLAISAGLTDVENNLREQNGISINESVYSNPLLNSFQNFRLSALMQ